MSGSLVGISSSYFATRGFGIYDSVKRALELGFETVELGAAHSFEPGVWETLKRIKADFSSMNFTVHGLFPPLKERFWFNASLGLTPKNRGVIDGMFRAASIAEALVVGIHAGFTSELEWGKDSCGMNLGVPKGKIKKEKGLKGLCEVLGHATRLSEDTGIRLAIENIPNEPEGALVYSVEEFRQVFGEFPLLGLLFDFGHAVVAGNVDEMLALNERVCEMHVHYTVDENPVLLDAHQPLPADFDFGVWKRIKQIAKIPLIFEHGNNVSEEEVLREKKMVEGFLKKHSG